MKILDEKIRHKLAWYDKRGQKYKEMEEDCPLENCNGKAEPVKFSTRKYHCPNCRMFFKVEYVPYLKVIEVEEEW
jgi:hypothetical protein